MVDSILIQNNRAHEIWRATSKSNLEFHPEIMDAIVQAPNNTVNLKDVWDGSTFSAPVPKPLSDFQIRKAQFDGVTIRDELVTKLKTATPAEIDTWVDNQVTDVASARLMFKRILLLIAPDLT